MTDREIKRTVFNLQRASFGKAVAIIHSIYAQGYADGHSACCEELSVEDGDEVITMSMEELKRRMSLTESLNDGVVDDQIKHIFDGLKEIKK